MTTTVFGFYRHFERSEKSCRNRHFSRQAKNFLTGGIYVIYNRSCFIDKAYFLFVTGNLYEKIIDKLAERW